MVQSKKHLTQTISRTALAVAAAGLFLAGTSAGVVADAKQAKVQCTGANGCKGKSDCATAISACHGQNACKGQGWLKLTEKECLDKGGKVEKS
jgi:hypothetical protein